MATPSVPPPDAAAPPPPPFSRTSDMPSVHVSEVVRAVVVRTLEELKRLQQQLVRKTVNERRALLGRALKIHRHRLIQLYALLAWGRRMGVVHAPGEAGDGPLARCEAGEARVLQLLIALNQALAGFPHLAGQQADHVNGLRHLQYTVMLTGKSVLYEVDVALDVLVNGTYSQFPRPSGTVLKLPDRLPYVDDGLLPPLGSDVLTSELNTAIRHKLLQSTVPAQFEEVKVRNGTLRLAVFGEFAVVLSLRSAAPDAPWLVERVEVHLGEGDGSDAEFTSDGPPSSSSSSPSSRYVALPDRGQALALRRYLTGAVLPRAAQPLVTLYHSLHALAASLALESLYVQAATLALASSLADVASARARLAAEVAGVAKRSQRRVAAAGLRSDAAAALGANVDVTGWGGGRLRVRYHPAACTLTLLYWPVAASSAAAGASVSASGEQLQALNPPAASLLDHAGAAMLEIRVPSVSGSSSSSGGGSRGVRVGPLQYRMHPRPASAAATHAAWQPIVRTRHGWLDILALLQDVCVRAGDAVMAGAVAHVTGAGTRADLQRTSSTTDREEPALLRAPIGGGLALCAGIAPRTGQPFLKVVGSAYSGGSALTQELLPRLCGDALAAEAALLTSCHAVVDRTVKQLTAKAAAAATSQAHAQAPSPPSLPGVTAAVAPWVCDSNSADTVSVEPHANNLAVIACHRAAILAKQIADAVVALVASLRVTVRRELIRQACVPYGCVEPLTGASFVNGRVAGSEASPATAASATPTETGTTDAVVRLTAPPPAHPPTATLPPAAPTAPLTHTSNSMTTYTFSERALFVKVLEAGRYQGYLVADTSHKQAHEGDLAWTYHMLITSGVEAASMEVFVSATSGGTRVTAMPVVVPSSSATPPPLPPSSTDESQQQQKQQQEQQSTMQFTRGGGPSRTLSAAAAAIAKTLFTADIVSGGGEFRHRVRGREELASNDALLQDGVAVMPVIGKASSSSAASSSSGANTTSMQNQAAAVPDTFGNLPLYDTVKRRMVWAGTPGVPPAGVVVLVAQPANFPPTTPDAVREMDAMLNAWATDWHSQGAAALVLVAPCPPSLAATPPPPAVFVPIHCQSSIPVVWAFGQAAYHIHHAFKSSAAQPHVRIAVVATPKRRVLLTVPLPSTMHAGPGPLKKHTSSLSSPLARAASDVDASFLAGGSPGGHSTASRTHDDIDDGGDAEDAEYDTQRKRALLASSVPGLAKFFDSMNSAPSRSSSTVAVGVSVKRSLDAAVAASHTGSNGTSSATAPLSGPPKGALGARGGGSLKRPRDTLDTVVAQSTTSSLSPTAAAASASRAVGGSAATLSRVVDEAARLAREQAVLAVTHTLFIRRGVAVTTTTIAPGELALSFELPDVCSSGPETPVAIALTSPFAHTPVIGCDVIVPEHLDADPFLRWKSVVALGGGGGHTFVREYAMRGPGRHASLHTLCGAVVGDVVRWQRQQRWSRALKAFEARTFTSNSRVDVAVQACRFTALAAFEVDVRVRSISGATAAYTIAFTFRHADVAAASPSASSQLPGPAASTSFDEWVQRGVDGTKIGSAFTLSPPAEGGKFPSVVDSCPVAQLPLHVFAEPPAVLSVNGHMVKDAFNVGVTEKVVIEHKDGYSRCDVPAIHEVLTQIIALLL